jgi:PAS domain S-box-containing protein
VVYAIVHPDDVHVEMTENYVAPGVMPLTGHLKMADFGEQLLARLRFGRSFVVADTGSCDLLSEKERFAYGKIGIAAIACSPLIKGGRFVANLNVHHGKPRDWTETEVELIAATSERTWDAIERTRADNALRRSEAKYWALFDNMADGLTVCHVVRRGTGRIVDVAYVAMNDAVERQTGRKREEFIGRRLSETSTSEDFEHWLPLYSRVARTGEPIRGEHHDPSSGRWLEFSINRSDDEELSIFIRDTSERKRTEADLRKSEQYFKALVTAGTYSVYRMSPDWRLMYQLDSDTLADTSAPIEDCVDKYIPEEDRELVFAAIEQAAIRTKSLFELEHRVRVANGGVGWVVSRAVPLLDAEGEIVEWFGAGTVVTERREALEKLRQSENEYRASLELQVQQRTEELKANRDHRQAILDCSPDMIQVFEAVRDQSGQIVDFNWVLNNHTSESLYGPILGQTLLERNPGVIAEGIFDAFKRVAETGVPEQAEHHYVHEQFDGWFYQSVVKLGDGLATTTKEISDWKNAQAEVARLERQVVDARLRESEARSQGLIEGLAQAFWEAGADARVVADSNSWRAYTGQSFDEWKDYGWLDAIHPDDREYAERQWREARSKKRMVDADSGSGTRPRMVGAGQTFVRSLFCETTVRSRNGSG